jgi:serine/threonine protein kinase
MIPYLSLPLSLVSPPLIFCFLSSLHRDLKYENILFVDDSPTAEVKLIDFGLSKQFYSKDEKECTDGVGTMYVNDFLLCFVLKRSCTIYFFFS